MAGVYSLLPDTPSIAVLPFTNMSGDPEQEYFSDGITEDIITELPRFRDLFLIARNSSFEFKNQPVDIADIGQKLGVRYVVEGSVRKSGKRARVTAQLIDAEREMRLSDTFSLSNLFRQRMISVLNVSYWPEAALYRTLGT